MIDSLHKYPLFPDLLENQKRSLEYFWEKGILEELELFSYLSRTNSQDFEEKIFSSLFSPGRDNKYNSGESSFFRFDEKMSSKHKIQLVKNPEIKFSNFPDKFFGMISESLSVQSETSVFGIGSKTESESSRTKNATSSSLRIDKFLLASKTQKRSSNGFRLNSLINRYGSRKLSYSMSFVPLCIQKLTGKGHHFYPPAVKKEKSLKEWSEQFLPPAAEEKDEVSLRHVKRQMSIKSRFGLSSVSNTLSNASIIDGQGLSMKGFIFERSPKTDQKTKHQNQLKKEKTEAPLITTSARFATNHQQSEFSQPVSESGKGSNFAPQAEKVNLSLPGESHQGVINNLAKIVIHGAKFLLKAPYYSQHDVIRFQKTYSVGLYIPVELINTIGKDRVFDSLESNSINYSSSFVSLADKRRSENLDNSNALFFESDSFCLPQRRSSKLDLLKRNKLEIGLKENVLTAEARQYVLKIKTAKQSFSLSKRFRPSFLRFSKCNSFLAPGGENRTRSRISLDISQKIKSSENFSDNFIEGSQEFIIPNKSGKIGESLRTVPGYEDFSLRRSYAEKIAIESLNLNGTIPNNGNEKPKPTWFYFGDIPLMTERGSFLINGAPRVLVNQIVRCPSLYFKLKLDPKNRRTYIASFLSDYGSWLRLETDRLRSRIWVRIDKSPRFPLDWLLSALGWQKPSVGRISKISSSSLTVEQNKVLIQQATQLIWKKCNASRWTSLIGCYSFFYTKFFHPRRYSLGKVGRLCLNKRLGRASDCKIPTLTPEDIFLALDYLIQLQTGNESGVFHLDDIDHLKNRRVRLPGEIIQNQFRLALSRVTSVVQNALISRKKSFQGSENKNTLSVGFSDSVPSSSFLASQKPKPEAEKRTKKDLENESAHVSNILFPQESLDSKQIEQSFEAQAEISTQISRGRVLSQMFGGSPPQTFVTTLRELFNTSQLSQYMDQTNPLAEITHKRRLSSLGPGGVGRDQAGFAVREIHPSHFGRICPIETPEGQNAGLVGSLASYARINSNGFLQSPAMSFRLADSFESKNYGTFQPNAAKNSKANEKQTQNESRIYLFSAEAEDDIFLCTADIGLGQANRSSSSFSSPNVPLGSKQTFSRFSLAKRIQQLTPNGDSRFENNRKITGHSIEKSKLLKDFFFGFPLGLRLSDPFSANLKTKNERSRSFFAAGRELTPNAEQTKGNNQLSIPVPIRYKQEFITTSVKKIQFTGICPIQMISVATSLIPFLEHDDANRALMGSNMQRQAVPLLFPEKPLVGTGLEMQAARDSSTPLLAPYSGKITYVDSKVIQLTGQFSGIDSLCNKTDRFAAKNTQSFSIQSYTRSNQSTSLNQRPAVQLGEWVEKGDVLADGSATHDGELSLGKNILLAYMPWEGYNFEDAIVINERLVYEDVYSSLHIERYEVDIRNAQPIRLIPSTETRETNKILPTLFPNFVRESEQDKKESAEKVFSTSSSGGNEKQKNFASEIDLGFDSSVSKPKTETDLIRPRLESFPGFFDSSINNGRFADTTLLTNFTDSEKLGVRSKGIKTLQPIFLDVGKDYITRDLDVVFGGSLPNRKTSLSTQEIEKSADNEFLGGRVEKDLLQESNNAERVENENNLALVSFSDSRSSLFPISASLKSELEAETGNRTEKKTENGNQSLQSAIPENSLFSSQIINLDSEGIIRPGTWVKEGDILVGKITPTQRTKLSFGQSPPEYRLLVAIFADGGSRVEPSLQIKFKNTSLKAGIGVKGRVIDCIIPWRDEEKRRLSDSLVGNQLIKTQATMSDLNIRQGRKSAPIQIFLAHKKRIQIGDKMSGRHGNKGIVSLILPPQDMPYTQDGKPVDVVLNPLGVPSRMNVGQVLESLLGLVSVAMHEIYRLMPFDEMYGKRSFDDNLTEKNPSPFIRPESSRSLVYSKLKKARNLLGLSSAWFFDPNNPGKTQIFDGRTGEIFHQPALVGYSYMFKLIHLVDDKIHARSTGPYSLVTQQPLGGRSKKGGQRLGEMEVWALEGFGASYILQEFLTVKSDEIYSRNSFLLNLMKRKSESEIEQISYLSSENALRGGFADETDLREPSNLRNRNPVGFQRESMKYRPDSSLVSGLFPTELEIEDRTKNRAFAEETSEWRQQKISAAFSQKEWGKPSVKTLSNLIGVSTSKRTISSLSVGGKNEGTELNEKAFDKLDFARFIESFSVSSKLKPLPISFLASSKINRIRSGKMNEHVSAGISKSRVPESFRVLVNELQALCLSVYYNPDFRLSYPSLLGWDGVFLLASKKFPSSHELSQIKNIGMHNS